MAERVGFEPTLPFRVNTLSKRAPSATRPSLRAMRSNCFDSNSAVDCPRRTQFSVLSSPISQASISKKNLSGSLRTENRELRTGFAAIVLEEKNQERDPEAAAAAALGFSGASGAAWPFVGGAGGAGEVGWAGLA